MFNKSASTEYSRRVAIIEGLRAGRTPSEIIRFFGYPRSTVYNFVARCKSQEESCESSITPDRKIHSKECTVRTSEVIERTQELILKDPEQSIRKLASIVGVSETTMRRIADEDLQLKVKEVLPKDKNTSKISVFPEIAKINEVVEENDPSDPLEIPSLESVKQEKEESDVSFAANAHHVFIKEEVKDDMEDSESMEFENSVDQHETGTPDSELRNIKGNNFETHFVAEDHRMFIKHEIEEDFENHDLSEVNRSSNSLASAKEKNLTKKRTKKLNEHNAIHDDYSPFSCTLCEKSFLRKESLNKHLKVHSGVNKQMCKVCNKVLATKESLKTHMMRHTGERNFTCEVCFKQFYTKSGLLLHTKSHENKKQHQCLQCKKSYNLKSVLNSHIRTVHFRERYYECDLCQKKFMQKSHLVVHLRIHAGERPYGCDFCNKTFRVKSNLIYHIMKHTGKYPVYCDKCSRGFISQSRLKTHYLSHDS